MAADGRSPAGGGMRVPDTVYFIRPVGQLGPIKIGCSYSPKDRLRAYSEWSPIPLELILTVPGSMKLERNLHECFADHHSHREWFFASPRLLAAIASMQAGVPVEEAVDLDARRGRIHALKMADALRRKGTSQETRAA